MNGYLELVCYGHTTAIFLERTGTRIWLQWNLSQDRADDGRWKSKQGGREESDDQDGQTYIDSNTPQGSASPEAHRKGQGTWNRLPQHEDSML